MVWRIHLKTPSLRDASASLDTWQEWRVTESPRRCCLVGYPSLVLGMRWLDRVRKDLRKFDIDERTWYTEVQESAEVEAEVAQRPAKEHQEQTTRR